MEEASVNPQIAAPPLRRVHGVPWSSTAEIGGSSIHTTSAAGKDDRHEGSDEDPSESGDGTSLGSDEARDSGDGDDDHEGLMAAGSDSEGAWALPRGAIIPDKVCVA